MYRQAYKCNPSEFTPNLTRNLCPVEFDQLVEFDWLNLTGRIGSKSIEIKTTKFNQAAILCTGRHTNVIPVNLHPIAQKFMPG